MSSLKNRLAAIPEGTGALFFIQTFATLGFAVLYSTLVLYATKHLQMTAKEATALMGVFGAFNYGLHLFGGYLGGRFLSNRALFVGGMVLQVFGCASIAMGTTSLFYWGLALFLTGSGLNVTCINMMLTQRFAPDDARREGAFLWNYAGMNIGFFIGFAAAGYFQGSQDYAKLFIFATVGNFLAIVLAAATWKTLADLNTPLLGKYTFAGQAAFSGWGRDSRRSGPHRMGALAISRFDRHTRERHLCSGCGRPRRVDRAPPRQTRATQYVGVFDPHAWITRILVVVPDGAQRFAALRRSQCRSRRCRGEGSTAMDSKHQHRGHRGRRPADVGAVYPLAQQRLEY